MNKFLILLGLIVSTAGASHAMNFGSFDQPGARTQEKHPWCTCIPFTDKDIDPSPPPLIQIQAIFSPQSKKYVTVEPSDLVENIAQKFNNECFHFNEAMTQNSGVQLIKSYNASSPQQPVILNYDLWQKHKNKLWTDYISEVMPSMQSATSFSTNFRPSTWATPTPDYIVIQSPNRTPPQNTPYRGGNGILTHTPTQGTSGTYAQDLAMAKESYSTWHSSKAIVETFQNPVTTHFEQLVAQHLTRAC